MDSHGPGHSPEKRTSAVWLNDVQAERCLLSDIRMFVVRPFCPFVRLSVALPNLAVLGQGGASRRRCPASAPPGLSLGRPARDARRAALADPQIKTVHWRTNHPQRGAVFLAPDYPARGHRV